jgi:hypothetical protein
MIGLKRFIRFGLVVSVIGHVGVLVLGLLLVGANSFESAPSDAMPPDAMVVDIVPPNEAPRLEGTPSDLRSSGSESSLKSNNANTAAQPPPPKLPAQSPQKLQQRADPQRDARQAKAQPRTTRPDTAHPETVQPETAEIQASEPPPDQPQPHREEAPDQPGAAEMVAELALVGGRLGGGFQAPAVNAVQAAYDFTAPFRERVSSCSAMPAGVDAGDNIKIALRVSFNPDATLASTPQLLEPIASGKEKALMQGAINALQKCQPYTMLMVEKYKRWKTLDLIFYPLNFLGG